MHEIIPTWSTNPEGTTQRTATTPGNFTPYSFRIVCGFFNVPHWTYKHRLVPRRTLARLMNLLLLYIAFKTSGSGKLVMNDPKTELLLIGTRQELAKITIDGTTVGHSVTAPQSSVRNLGVWLDCNLSISDHITKTSSAAFYYLYNIRRIRKYLSKECTETLIHAFISSRLDYCSSLLYGLIAYHIQKLQRARNSAACLVILSYYTIAESPTLVTRCISNCF